MAADMERGNRGQGKKPAAAAEKQPSGHWRRRLLVMLAVFVVILGLLPSVLSYKPVFAWILKKGTADLDGTVTVESASFGWLSPIEVRGVNVTDAKGRPILELPSAKGDRSLASLLVNYKNLGCFTLTSPKVSVVLRENGSNAEDLVAKYLKPTKPQKQPAGELHIGVSIVVVDGSIAITDQVLGQTWRTEKFNASFGMSPDAAGPMTGSLAFQLSDARRVGTVDVGFKMAGNAGEAKLTVAKFPLAALRPILAKCWPGANVVGSLSSELRASWGGTGGKDGIEANLVTEEFAFAAPALQGDVLRLDRFQVGCQASWKADRIDFAKASLDCDFANIQAVGTMPFGGKDGVTFAGIARQRQDVQGRIDLARLARLLPNTLHLQENMQVQSGDVQWRFASQSGPQGAAWHGQIETANLNGLVKGRSIVWEKPISAILDAHDTAAGPVIDTLRCESDFLKIQAAGTPDDLNGTISLSLRQLGDHLGQFIKVGELQLGGEGQGGFRWKRSPQQEFDAVGQLEVRGFQCSQSTRQPWREDMLTVFASAKGKTDLSTQGTRIDAATLGVKAGADQIDAKLLQPVARFGDGAWAVGVLMRGQLRDWPARLAAWMPLGNVRWAGGYALDVEGTYAGGDVQVRKAIADLTDLAVLDGARQYQVRAIQLAAKGDYDAKLQTVRLTECVFRSNVLAAGAAGSIATEKEKCIANLDGKIRYNLQQASELLRPLLGSSVSFAPGENESDVRFRGPFDLGAASASAGVRWQGANIYGFPLGPAELKATLANGVARIEPIDMTVSQGRVHLAPQVRLNSSPMTFDLPKGKLLDRVQIDPAMCASMLKFAAPALAGATSVRGNFSVELDTCRIPLGDVGHGDLSGRIVIHTVEVGSGPMLRELSTLLGRDVPAKIRQESVVSFRMKNGRVYHDGLDLQFPDITIRTRGSVGLDETLDIIAEMPVPPKWLAGNPLATQAMRSQIILLPLKGTLHQPKLDPKEMERLSAQFLRKAAGNVLEGGLNQLFGPKK